MAKGKKEIKYVYRFGGKKADGKSEMKNLLGGKGANLAEMTNIGIPVPPGFTITTEMCTVYYKLNRKYPKALDAQIRESMKHIEKTMGTGAEFGSETNPLLVSVRSGARVSMPGMMDTVLNLGLNDKTVVGLAKQSGNERFAWDAYRRFVQMYGDVVLGLKPQTKTDIDPFEEIMDELKHAKGVKLDVELGIEDLKELVKRFKAIIKERKGINFPEDPWQQLWGAIEAVFGSWNGDRAIKYRVINKIPHDWGTAVNVQAMVFGNMGDDSGTGVAFTRNPSTGDRRFYGEYLINAQGEDVVAGIRTPQPINSSTKSSADQQTLEEVMPIAYKTLVDIYKKLEKHYRDMQDIEFTIQKGKLWMLQTRNGKRTAAAALKIACDMVNEKMITPETAVLRIAPEQLDQLLHPMFDPKAAKEVIAKGLPASPGAATGQAVFHAEDAEAWAKEGKKVILVRIETSPEDIGGMDAAQGILTARGGMTSHAAVVARGMGKCCIAGCGAININESQRYFTVNTFNLKEGDYLTLNGTTGEVILGEAPLITPELTGDFGIFMKWVDGFRKLGVRTNADTPHDAAVARDFGAQGIGLCRTEHMFFEPERIIAVREMILADDTEGRQAALAKLLPMQKGDFKGIFKAMKGLPVTIRLLDPPLHEFLPHTDEELKALAHQIEVPVDKLKSRNKLLHEFNPILGHRGCRLGITYPEIYAMQAQAIMEAACELAKQKIKVIPEIMIPLVGHVNELKMMRELVIKVAADVQKKYKIKVNYTVGTMIELPRAAITADEIAAQADFFSFGTNDLTQTTFGLSRDDAGRFLPFYVEKGILEDDPFITLDQGGTGLMMKIAIEKGRKVKKDLKMGICGEHGGDPRSVEFCHKIGLNYVSCSPYRVPIARLAGAQAALKEKM